MKGGTVPLLSILIQRISTYPYHGYFVAQQVSELPSNAEDFWRIKYEYISGDDYLVSACRVWADQIFTRRMNAYSKIWKGDWVRWATATPPQEFTLPLAAGWTRHRSCQYFKTQDNVVTVYFQVKADAPKSGETIIATLPVGFRPSDLIGGTGYCVMPDSIYCPADIKVFQDGNITGFNTQGEAQYYTGFFTFVAGA